MKLNLQAKSFEKKKKPRTDLTVLGFANTARVNHGHIK
jgi:hypothetical protein